MGSNRQTPEIVGLTELSEMTSIATSTLGVWLRRGHLPTPDVQLACGPIWYRRSVERWRRSADGQARIKRVRDKEAASE